MQYFLHLNVPDFLVRFSIVFFQKFFLIKQTPTFVTHQKIIFFMKKMLTALSAIAMVALTSCSVTMPVAISSNPVGNKVGSAKTVAIVGLFFDGGDASIQTAAKNGKISKISTVDFKQTHYLGMLYSEYETIITGE
jgi:hypothetical protein